MKDMTNNPLYDIDGQQTHINNLVRQVEPLAAIFGDEALDDMPLPVAGAGIMTAGCLLELETIFFTELKNIHNEEYEEKIKEDISDIDKIENFANYGVI